jgi:hypothetical protein
MRPVNIGTEYRDQALGNSRDLRRRPGISEVTYQAGVFAEAGAGGAPELLFEEKG